MSGDSEFGNTYHPPPELSEGQSVFAGRYTLVEKIGQGGMGVVWKARDTHLDLDVALKFVPDLLRLDGESVHRLKAEAVRGRQLHHTHIVAIYDYLEDRKYAAIAMEFVDGESLAAKKVRQPGECFDVDDIREWMDQLCEALSYAHEKHGIVHRDIKPANLLIDKSGHLRVLDFGLSRLMSDTASRQSRGRFEGASFGYASPQQLRGKKASVSDDLYGLGATLYDLLTGLPPFHSGDITWQTIHEVAPSIGECREEAGVEGIAGIPSEWEEAIGSCLAKDSKDRPETVAALREQLSRPLEPAPVVAVPAVENPVEPPGVEMSPASQEESVSLPDSTDRGFVGLGSESERETAAELGAEAAETIEQSGSEEQNLPPVTESTAAEVEPAYDPLGSHPSTEKKSKRSAFAATVRGTALAGLCGIGLFVFGHWFVNSAKPKRTAGFAGDDSEMPEADRIVFPEVTQLPDLTTGENTPGSSEEPPGEKIDVFAASGSMRKAEETNGYEVIGAIGAGDSSAPSSPPASTSGETPIEGGFSLVEARETINRFLDARNWRERLPHIYAADVLRGRIEDYYRVHPDSAFTQYHLKYLLMDENPREGDIPLFVFFLKLADRDDEFPITVRRLPDGMKVDWGAFVEFHDRRFGKFLESDAAGPQSLRLIIERQSYWGEDRSKMNGYLAFQVESPDPEYSAHAFVPDNTVLATQLEEYFSWGAGPIATTIELERQKLPHGESHYIINRLVTDPEAADGWHIKPGSEPSGPENPGSSVHETGSAKVVR